MTVNFSRLRGFLGMYKMLKKLKKFGWNEYEFTTMIWNLSVLLRCLTVNIDSRNKNGIPLTSYLLTIFMLTTYLYVYFFSMLWYLFVRYPETNNLVAAMVLLSLGVCSETGIIKFLFMVVCSKEVRRVVDNFLECDSHVIPGSRFSNNMLKTLRIVKKRAVLYWVVIVCNGTVYNVTPLFLSGRHLSEDFLVLYGMEPMLETPHFEIATFLVTVTVTFVCFSVATVSGFIIIIVGYLEAHILSLSEEMKEIWMDAVADKKKKKRYKYYKTEPLKLVNIYVNHRLADIINIHQTSIKLLNDVENLFRAPMGIGFVCLSVSLVAILLGGLESTYLELPFVVVQVTVDCYLGQKIMDACEVFSRAIYDCKWENFDNANKKIVLSMLANSQKPMILTAGGRLVLSFSSLMDIMGTVYNVYTKLRTMVNKNI